MLIAHGRASILLRKIDALWAQLTTKSAGNRRPPCPEGQGHPGHHPTLSLSSTQLTSL